MTTTREAAEKAGIVRPLVFRNDMALTPFGVYQIEDTKGGFVWSLEGIRGNHFFPCRERGQAEAAAQADFEKKVRKGINPDFLSELDTARKEVERLREALKPFAALGQYMIDEGFNTKPDEATMWGFDRHDLTYGDFRTAARTLSPDTTEGGE